MLRPAKYDSAHDSITVDNCRPFLVGNSAIPVGSSITAATGAVRNYKQLPLTRP